MPRLPEDLDLQANELGAFRRSRGIVRPSDLLRAVLAYALYVSSFRKLGAWGVLIGLADLSEGAWRKRVRACSR